jgi:hypothetical protein
LFRFADLLLCLDVFCIEATTTGASDSNEVVFDKMVYNPIPLPSGSEDDDKSVDEDNNEDNDIEGILSHKKAPDQLNTLTFYIKLKGTLNAVNVLPANVPQQFIDRYVG